MPEVYITKTGKFLPNQAVSNDEMEAYLGLINDATSKARRLILRNNKIINRYYALDKSGKSTHTNAEMTKNAVQTLYDSSFTNQDMQLLSCGTTTPDVTLPSHAAMVHGHLKNKSVELNSSAGACCAGMNALKYGYLSVKAGNTTNAVCTGSERTSTWMLSDKFEQEVVNLKTLEEQPIVAFKKDFLRFMLSDGAGCFLLENKPKPEGISLKIEWMEAFSYAFEIETCMYAGGDKQENGDIKPWSDYNPDQWLKESIFAMKQDVKLLDANILIKGTQSTKESLQKNNVPVSEIDYFLPHVSSHYFVDGLYKEFVNQGIEIPMKKWFLNLATVGNVGAASIYIALDELVNSGKLKKGEKILLSVPESARFSYAYAYLTVC